LSSFVSLGMVTKESLRKLENELTFTRLVNKEYSKVFGQSPKVGYTINVRKPVRFTNSNGQALILQDITEQTVPVVLNKQYQRSFAVSSADFETTIEMFSERYISPAMISMANEIDYDGLAQFKNIANEVGTPGTVPTNTSTYLAALALLQKEAAPTDDLNLVISPDMNASIVQNMQGLFNPQVQLSDMWRKGLMARKTVGFNWYMDQNVNIQTVGPQGGTPTVNATAGQIGSSVVTTGWTAAVGKRLNKGDVIQFAGVNGVNPQNRQSYGRLRDFEVTSDFFSDASGNGTISISPAIIPGNADGTNTAYQNVTNGPAANAAITINGVAGTATPRGLAFHKDAFTFATADLPLWKGTDMMDRKVDPDIQVSMRVWRDGDINLDRAVLRTDVLGGWTTLYPELAVRIAS
jgi:hypothetical protein